MRMKAIACVLACQLAIPATPMAAEAPRPEKEKPRWVEGTLIAVDRVQRSVSYRVEPGEARMAAIGSDGALRKLTDMKVGQQVKLKVGQTGDGSAVVEGVKKVKSGGKWWLWGIAALAAAGAVWLVMLFFFASE